MAKVTGITKEKLENILGDMVTGASVDAGGVLRLQTRSGTVISGGDFNAAVSAAAVPVVKAEVKAEVKARVTGTPIPLGDISGSITQLLNKTQGGLVNSIVTAKAVGNLTFSTSYLPSDATPGTQFAFRITQDSIGGRTLSLTGFKVNMGILNLSSTPNAIDILVFLYDGSNWYAGMMGASFS